MGCYSVGQMDVEQLFEAIRHLPPAERLRLVERVVHDVEAAAIQTEPGSLLGAMADEPEVVDEACRLAMAARANSRMRLADR